MESGDGLKPIEVLVIEDNEIDLFLTVAMLQKAGQGSFQIHSADRISRGIELGSEGKTDVILMDLNLPDGQGLDTFRRLKSCFPSMPIVVLSGLEDEAISRQAVREGAQDYLLKGQTDGKLLERSIRYAIERQKSEERILELAFHDPLTGLPNRSLFIDRCLLSLAESKRHHKDLAIMQLDLDHFKGVNDNFGHEAGDRVLKEVAQRLSNSLRLTDTIGRLGGDEFGVLIPDMENSDLAVTVADKILEIVRRPFVEGHRLTASIGIAISPDNGGEPETLLRIADIKMYEAKKSGGDAYRLASATIQIRG